MDEETLNRKLIDAVSERALLYNPFHPDRKNKHKQDNTWKEIAASLNSTVQFCQSRWSNLRSTYCRKHKKSTTIASGSAIQPQEQWPYFSQLSFLEGYVKHRSSTDNLSFSVGFEKEILLRSLDEVTASASSFTADSSEYASCSINPPTNPLEVLTTELQQPEPSIVPCKRKKKENNDKELKNELLKFLQKKEDQLDNLNEGAKLDRFDHFANFVASELRMKDEKVVRLYMQQITQLLYADIVVE